MENALYAMGCGLLVAGGAWFWLNPADATEGVPQVVAAKPARAASAPSLPADAWPAAIGDPFSNGKAVTAVAPLPTEPPVAVVMSAPLPPPPPEPRYRYFGRMQDPDGQERVYLSNGERLQPATAGEVLDDGYRIELVQAEMVQLHEPLSGTRVQLSLPSP